MGNFNVINVEAKVDGSSFLKYLNPFRWFKKTYTKETVNILFIDDSDMPVVENLRKAGYRVKKIRDVKDIDDADVKNSQIIFVDYDGVGRYVSPLYQGAGLVKELKTKYEKLKYVVLYTAQSTLPSDTTMQSLFDAADARMRKDADTTDFTNQIRTALRNF